MGQHFRVSAYCPRCHEEHLGVTISLTDDEQREYDEFYVAHPGRSVLDDVYDVIEDVFGDAPLVVRRTVRCGVCGEIFSQRFRICKSMEVSRMGGV